MNKNLLNKEVQDFVQQNIHGDLNQLIMKKSPFALVSTLELAQQIKGRATAQKKFPFLQSENIIFPPQLNLEQASSESTGKYKATLASGKNMVDLTSGFGVDAFWLSQNFQEVILVERNQELLEIVKHNWQVLGRKATFENIEIQEFLKNNSTHFDLVFLDPARRDENKNKVFLLEDLSPNILEIQEDLLQISSTVMVKLSPLIDISYLISSMKNLLEIHIVAVKNEVKEILLKLKSDNKQNEIKMKMVNLESSETAVEVFWDEIIAAETPTYSEPKKYLYIPNNALLKSGAFNWMAKHYQLEKLHPNTQLFTSENFVGNFPGRILQVQVIEPKTLKKNEQYNIVAKNYPLKPEEIKKKYSLKDGGRDYLIFTQTVKRKVVLSTILSN